jgi:DNA-binding transcriptional LysR family regulator
MDLFPDIRITLITTDEELDLAMREADVAIRLRQPTQPDLIQRKLFSVHFHAYASAEYLKRTGTPRTLEELDNHRIIVLGGSTVPAYLQNRNWLTEANRDGKGPRQSSLIINNIMGLLRACQRGLGVALLPDYLVEENEGQRSMRSSSTRKSSNQWHACKRFGISWSATRSAGASEHTERFEVRSFLKFTNSQAIYFLSVHQVHGRHAARRNLSPCMADMRPFAL